MIGETVELRHENKVSMLRGSADHNEHISKMNTDGWRLIGSATAFIFDGLHHLVYTWERWQP